MKNLFLIFLITSFAFNSCVTKKRCNDKFPPEVSKLDSNNFVERTIIKDTTVHDTIPGDTVFVPIPVECDPKTNKPINTKTKVIHSDQFIDVNFGIKNNEPWINVIRKPIYRDYLFQKIYAEKLREHFIKNSTVVTVTEKEIPTLIWFVIGALLLLCFLILMKS